MDPSYSPTDEQGDAANKGDAQVDGTDIDNPGEEYTKISKDIKEPDNKEISEDTNNEDEYESSSSDDDTVVNSGDSDEEPFEDTRNDTIEGQVEVDFQQEFDASGNEATYVDSNEEIAPVQEHPTQSREEHTQRSGVDVLQTSIGSTDEGEDHRDETADISQEHVEAFVNNVIKGAREIVGNEPEIENNIFESDHNLSFPVEDDGINDETADNRTDDKLQTVSGDIDTDTSTMGEGASKHEPQNLSEHPLIPADISDLTADEAKGPTGDKIIIIDYKKRRPEPETTEYPSSFEANEESDEINGRQNDSLASDPVDAVKDKIQGSDDDEGTFVAQMHHEKEPFSLHESLERDRGDEETPLSLIPAQDTETAFDGTLASDPNGLPIDTVEDPKSFSEGDASSEYDLERQNIETTFLQRPDGVVFEEDSTGFVADIDGDGRSDSEGGDEVTPNVTESDITSHEDGKDEIAEDNLEDNIDDNRNADSEKPNQVEDIARQEMVQTEESALTDNLRDLTYDEKDIELSDKEGTFGKDSDDMSENDDTQSEEHQNELEVSGGDTPFTNIEGDVPEDSPHAQLEHDDREQQERIGSPFEIITDDDVVKEGQFERVEEKIDLPISASCEHATFAGNLEPEGEIFNDGNDFQKDSSVEDVDFKFEDDTSEQDEVLVLDSGDNNLTEPMRYDGKEESSDDTLGEDDENEKADKREELPMFTSDDETPLTGNLKSVCNDTPEDVVENLNGFDTVRSHEGDGKRVATPISVSEDESLEKEDSVSYPINVPEDKTANTEMSLYDAIEANNLYLSKSCGDPQSQYEQFPVPNLSGEVDGYQGIDDNEAGDAADESLERTNEDLPANDSVGSDHIGSDEEDAIESEKLAKDLEEKRIEEMSLTNPEQEQSLEELVINEENASEPDDGWESSGSESTSTTPSIDYGEHDDEEEESKVDENNLESQPYVENDSDDILVEEAVTFQENLSLESSNFKNLLNHLNHGSHENSDENSPRRTYTDKEVRKAIQILTSRPPYDKTDVDYETFYEGMSRAETLRVFALVLAPKEQQRKERVFGIFANPEDVPYDNRYIGDYKEEEKIAPTLTDKNVDLSELIAGLEQPISSNVSEDVETCPEAPAEESQNLYSQKYESEDDETESSSSASSGMYVVGDYPGILEDERGQMLLMEEHESTPVSYFDDEYQTSDIPFHGGKFFCVTKTFVQPGDEIYRTDQFGSESAPIQAFSAVPPNVERPLPTHKTTLHWIDPEDSKDVKTPEAGEKENHQPVDGLISVETETRILHLSEDNLEYDMYLIHQPTENDAENVDEEDVVYYNVHFDHDSREDLEIGPESKLEDAIVPITQDTNVFRPQNMGDGEWQKVDSPEKIDDVKTFEFNPLEVKHISFEENVLPIDEGSNNVHENDIVPEVLEPIKSSEINFDFDEPPESHAVTEPATLVTTIRFNTPENNDRLDKQQLLDGITDIMNAPEDGQRSNIEEGNLSDQEDLAHYNAYLDHDSSQDLGDGLGSKLEDAIVPTTHDTKSVFNPQDMGHGEWEKVNSPEKIDDAKSFDFNPPEVRHRSFEENVLPIDHGKDAVHENEIVAEVLEPIESSQINFGFDEPPETHAVTEPPILVTTIRFKTPDFNDRPDKQQLLDGIAGIFSDEVFQENEDAESIDSNPPHFRDEDEPLLENLHASKDQNNERPLSIAALLRDVGITEDNDVLLGGSAFVVVGTPSAHLPGDEIKLSEIEMEETMPPQRDNLIAGQEKTAGNQHEFSSSSFSSSSSSSSSDESDSGEKEEFPYESLDNEIDPSNKGDDDEGAGYLPSLTLPLEQLSSSSSTSYDDDEHVDVGLNYSDQRHSGRRSSSSSSCSSNNTAQEPGVPERLDTDQASEKHGYLADLHDITSRDAAEYFSSNTSTDGLTDVTVISINKESDDLEHSSDDFEVQAFLEKGPIFEDEDHKSDEVSDETDMYNNDFNNPITEKSDVTMAVYLEKVPSVDETVPSADTPYDSKLEEENSFQIPEKTLDNEQDTRPTVADTIPPVSFNMYLDTAPLEESPVEMDTYLEHVPKLESDREADVRLFSTSDSDDVTPPRGRVESSSAASAFSDSDVGEEQATSQPSIIFAVYGKVSETNYPEEKPMVVAIHQSQKSLSSHDLQEDDERSYEFQGSVEVYREEEFGEIHKRSVTSFVEISRSSRQSIDQVHSTPDLDVVNDDSVK